MNNIFIGRSIAVGVINKLYIKCFTIIGNIVIKNIGTKGTTNSYRLSGRIKVITAGGCTIAEAHLYGSTGSINTVAIRIFQHHTIGGGSTFRSAIGRYFITTGIQSNKFQGDGFHIGFNAVCRIIGCAGLGVIDNGYFKCITLLTDIFIITRLSITAGYHLSAKGFTIIGDIVIQHFSTEYITNINGLCSSIHIGTVPAKCDINLSTGISNFIAIGIQQNNLIVNLLTFCCILTADGITIYIHPL